MDFFEDRMVEDKTKNKKKARNIIIAIVIVLILCLAIGGVIVYLQSLQLKTYLDGGVKNFAAGTIKIEENGKVYVSINDIAKSLGYNYLNGEYGQASEETTKGYVQNENEVAMFETNSNKIYKTSLKDKSSEYSYFYIDEPVKYIDGKLYTTPEGIKIGFNTTFQYSKEKNTITIYTLPYLVNFYTTSIVNYGYKSIDENFYNQKAIISDMIVAKKENGKVGVIDTAGKEIIGPKYDSIIYDETSSDFFVKSGNKKGLVDKQGRTRIALSYDDIQLLDKDSELYLVTNSSKYGVVNRSGDVIIYLEYDKIGVDASLYKNSDIKNPYLLFDNCILVQKNSKWNIMNKKGNNILPDQLKDLDGVGCVVGTSSNKSAGNILILPDYEAIVVMKNKKYGLVSSTGQELIACGLDAIYSITSNGKTTYQMEYQGKTLNVEEYLESHGVKKVNTNKGIIDNANDIDVVPNNTQTNVSNTANSTSNDVLNNTMSNSVENESQTNPISVVQ